jgi:hypothetical protein
MHKVTKGKKKNSAISLFLSFYYFQKEIQG